MPKRGSVKPQRPTVGEIGRLLRAGGDDYWVDEAGRTYGFMSTGYSRALWDSGAMDVGEAHLWVLLPRARAGAKADERPIFPRPGDPIDLRPRARPRSYARMQIRTTRYASRPRRQRAAAIVAAVEVFAGDLRVPIAGSDTFREKTEPPEK